MSKQPALCILTANRLADGIVVFLDFEGDWSQSPDEAVVARSPDEARALEDRGAYDAARNLVVEPYLVEVRETAGGLLPVRTRERVRAGGPSILDDVPGYNPSPRASRGVRPLAHPRAAPNQPGGEGSDPLPQAPAQHASAHPSSLPASGEREAHAEAA
jgi:hypothetical protein